MWSNRSFLLAGLSILFIGCAYKPLRVSPEGCKGIRVGKVDSRTTEPEAAMKIRRILKRRLKGSGDGSCVVDVMIRKLVASPSSVGYSKELGYTTYDYNYEAVVEIEILYPDGQKNKKRFSLSEPFLSGPGTVETETKRKAKLQMLIEEIADEIVRKVGVE